MHDDRLKSLYARLLAQRPDTAEATAPYAIARALRGDAESLSQDLARAARQDRPQRRLAPALGWAMAAAVALVAVFASRQLGQDPAQPTGLPADRQDMIAEASPPQPLFSGSFENGERHKPAEVIFDNDFGS